MLKGPIVRLRYDSQEELCQAMCRVQEFYESPYEEIRGKYFTMADFVRRYTADHGGKFTYFTDWHGFNIPGHVANAFFYIFEPLTSAEAHMLNVIRASTEPGRPFYIIATYEGGEVDDPGVEAHEECHANWYLDGAYRDDMEANIGFFASHGNSTYAALVRWLTAKGYCDAVIPDEVQAYMATTPKDYWQSELGEAGGVVSDELADNLWAFGARFRDRASAQGIAVPVK